MIPGGRIRRRLALQGNRFVVSELRLFPWPDDDGPRVASKNAAGTPWEHGENWGVHAIGSPAGGVLARILRRVPLHGAIERASFWPLHWTDLLLDREGNRIERQPSPKPPRRGRRPVPDEELLKVAKVYDEAFRGGAKKNPTQAVAARFRNMSPARAGPRIPCKTPRLSDRSPPWARWRGLDQGSENTSEAPAGTE